MKYVTYSIINDNIYLQKNLITWWTSTMQAVEDSNNKMTMLLDHCGFLFRSQSVSLLP